MQLRATSMSRRNRRDARCACRGQVRAHARSARLLSAAALLGAALAVTGCAGSSSSTGVAHLSSTKNPASTARSEGSGSSPESTASPQQTGLAFAKCMRSNGLPNFPDPTAGGGFFIHAGAGIDPSSPAFKAAQAKCHELLPAGGPPSTTHPSTQTLARFTNIARCMREHGVYDFPDPRTSVPANPFGSTAGGGVISDIEGVIFVFPGTIDEQSPAFTRAAGACAFPLHNH
jgi:hypothetical protein